MISLLVGLSPALGSVLTAQSLELLWILCLPLSLPLSACTLSLSLSKINKHFKKIKIFFHLVFKIDFLKVTSDL